MQPMLNWLGPARLPFLILTPACVVLGVACVQWTQGQVNTLQAWLVLLGAVEAPYLLVCILTPTLITAGMLLA